MILFKMAFLIYVLIAGLMNAVIDTPHAPESRPDAVEVCYNAQHTELWLEMATPTSYVCDGTGYILFKLVTTAKGG